MFKANHRGFRENLCGPPWFPRRFWHSIALSKFHCALKAPWSFLAVPLRFQASIALCSVPLRFVCFHGAFQHSMALCCIPWRFKSAMVFFPRKRILFEFHFFLKAWEGRIPQRERRALRLHCACRIAVALRSQRASGNRGGECAL